MIFLSFLFIILCFPTFVYATRLYLLGNQSQGIPRFDLGELFCWWSHYRWCCYCWQKSWCSMFYWSDGSHSSLRGKTELTLPVISVWSWSDHFLLLQATWHATANLPQTLGSRFDIGSPETLSSHVLVDSFCRVVKITCDAVTSVFSSSYSNNVLPNVYPMY